MVRLVDDDGVVGESLIVDMLEELADVFINSGDECVVEIAWVLDVFVMFEPFSMSLVGVVRCVECEVHEEWFLFVFGDEV